MISIRDISLNYSDRTVLRNFSAEIANGSITVISGRNGAGKSTLLAAIAGDIKPSAGEIEINKKLLSSLTLNELATIRSVAQQSHSYWMSYTAREILMLGNEKARTERLKYLIEKLDLQSFLDQAVTTLSGGQLQRIEIARAFLRELPLVLLDEPFASQDISSIQRIRELLQEEKANGVTIILVDHAKHEDHNWCDQVIDLEARSLVQ